MPNYSRLYVLIWKDYKNEKVTILFEQTNIYDNSSYRTSRIGCMYFSADNNFDILYAKYNTTEYNTHWQY